MAPLTLANIESELSYAYLHAVVSNAGMACEAVSRHQDSAGVDARIIAWGPFPGTEWCQEVDLKVQLKATVKAPSLVNGCLSYSLAGVSRYDDLRSDCVSVPRILVVLFLDEDRDRWLTQTENALSLQRCAYWVSLRGANASGNKTAQTVYFPKSQRFDSTGLKALMAAVAQNNVPTYDEVLT